ncbi:hypothetical protein GIB67_007794 [Kingdonia uniflora]|uniref:CASP-like protein n=1 Tax=Kingdonia uniflora TaxID=39325 RepID=A0A7J7N1Y8_9MAGN|nr:hypothetical protein GIB67_007794 [Kingdonia uniflora]
MRMLNGGPGTVIGLLLRLGQFLFSVTSAGLMCSAKRFGIYTAFCFLIAAMGLQGLWSLGLACLDVYALKKKRHLQNPAFVGLFVIGDWVTSLPSSTLLLCLRAYMHETPLGAHGTALPSKDPYRDKHNINSGKRQTSGLNPKYGFEYRAPYVDGWEPQDDDVLERERQFSGRDRDRSSHPLVDTPLHDRYQQRPLGSPPRPPRHPYATTWQNDEYSSDSEEELRPQLRRKGYRPISEWWKMRRELKERFIHMNYGEDAFGKLQSLKMGLSSLDDYTDKYYLFEACARLHETEQQRVSRYKSGLTKKLQEATTLQPVFYLAKIVQLAKQANELHAQYRPPVPAATPAAPAIPAATAPRTFVGLVVDGMRESVIATVQRVLHDEDEEETGMRTTYVHHNNSLICSSVLVGRGDGSIRKGHKVLQFCTPDALSQVPTLNCYGVHLMVPHFSVLTYHVLVVWIFVSRSFSRHHTRKQIDTPKSFALFPCNYHC